MPENQLKKMSQDKFLSDFENRVQDILGQGLSTNQAFSELQRSTFDLAGEQTGVVNLDFLSDFSREGQSRFNKAYASLINNKPLSKTGNSRSGITTSALSGFGLFDPIKDRVGQFLQNLRSNEKNREQTI